MNFVVRTFRSDSWILNPSFYDTNRYVCCANCRLFFMGNTSTSNCTQISKVATENPHMQSKFYFLISKMNIGEIIFDAIPHYYRHLESYLCYFFKWAKWYVYKIGNNSSRKAVNMWKSNSPPPPLLDSWLRAWLCTNALLKYAVRQAPFAQREKGSPLSGKLCSPPCLSSSLSIWH